jgi:predicted ATPase/Tfp pilus assembly protein PilF
MKTPVNSPASFKTFGDLLKHLRRRAQLSQRELALAVGYHYAHISRLEHNQRLPDAATIKALFVPALRLENEPAWVARLLALAAAAHGETAPAASGFLYARPALPTPLTPLLGRETVMAEARAQLDRAEVRLLTLSGPPGIGKTRLAVQLAAELAERFADGVVFVDLTSVREPDLVPGSIAGALEVQETAGQSLQSGLRAALRAKALLLVLDNFEQVIDAAPLVSELLQAAPRVKVLATSRETLRIAGEHELQVPSLPPPDGIQLFVQRARAVRADFALTPEVEPVVAEICTRLDGLPLAIELAAARIRLFSPPAMLARLDRRLHWLTGGSRERPAWQQTLRGAIDWSYNLLEPAEQRALARLAVFAGGCAPEAAEAVTGAPLETLIALADKSLVALDTAAVSASPQGARLTLLETLREYALERLLEDPAEHAAARHAHAGWYNAQAEAARPHLARDAAWLNQLEREHDNLRAALSWTLEHEPATGVTLTLNLTRFWALRGHFSESVRWQTAALPHAGAAQRLALTRQLGEACWQLGDLASAHAYLTESLALVRATPDRGALVDTLSLVGRVVKDMGDYEGAQAYLAEGLALAREQGDSPGLIPLLRNLGNVNMDLGRLEESRRCYEESLAVARRHHDRMGIAGALNNLGIVHLSLKDYEAARSCLLEALVIFQQDGFQYGTAMAVVILGRVAHAQGALAEARKNFETSLRLAREVGRKWSVAYALSNLGLVACSLGDWAEAERAFRESLQTALDADAPPRALDALGGWAVLAAQQGRVVEALEWLGLVLQHRATEHEARDRAQTLLAELSATVPPEQVEAALNRGAALDWEQVARARLAG